MGVWLLSVIGYTGLIWIVDIFVWLYRELFDKL